jgi:ribose transport system ATP-binding protein
MSVLEARNITKVFPGVTALDGVSLAIEGGTIHCIIGENGAGKSTLIKILTGIQSADEGEIIIDGALVERGDLNNKKNKKLFENIAYAPQELDLFNDLSVAENLFMPFKASGIKGVINKNSLRKMAIPWLERFKMSAGPGELVKNISVSERQMLQIARSMTNSNAKILMLDEPTTSLTASEAGRLFTVLKELKSQGKAIIFISHKLEEIFEIGDKITVLRNGQKIADAVVSEVDIPWIISAMVGSEVNQEESYKSEKVGDEVLMTVKGLTGAKFSDIDFTLRQGEILGFSGLVGSGRTEIMQALFGYLPVWAGEAFIEGKSWRFGKTDFSVRD